MAQISPRASRKQKEWLIVANNPPRRTRSLFFKTVRLYQKWQMRCLRQERNHWTLLWILECPRIRKVWKYFPSTPSRLSCSPFVVSTSSVFYPFSIAPTSVYSSCSSFLIATIIFWIWSSRNFATFHNSTLTPKQIITLIRNDVASHIRCATEDSVKNFWSLLSVFCSVNDDHTITFHL